MYQNDIPYEFMASCFQCNQIRRSQNSDAKLGIHASWMS
jgi:hypothetical protein